MATLTMTARRIAVLRAIDRGEVQRHRGWGKGEKTHDTWTRDGRQENVTHTCNDLTKADPRLIAPGRTLGPSLYSPQLWEPTPAGRQWLADNPEGGR